MAPFSTTDAATILGVSASHLKNFARAAGIKAVRVGGRGRSYRLMWGSRHLLALTLAATLRGLGIQEADAVALIRGIASLPSDEALEAVVKNRPYALIVTPFLCPHFLDAGAVHSAGEAGGSELLAQGHRLKAINLADLYAGVTARMRAVVGVIDAAT